MIKTDQCPTDNRTTAALTETIKYSMFHSKFKIMHTHAHMHTHTHTHTHTAWYISDN